MELIQADAQGMPFRGRARTARDGMFTNIYVPRYLEPNQLGSALVFCMGSKVEGTLISLRLVGSFFDFIPARIGYNTALDDAVSCLCSIYSRKYSTPYGHQKHIYQSYVKALSSLRTYLDDPVTRMESETLCASILLQMGEVGFHFSFEAYRNVQWLTKRMYRWSSTMTWESGRSSRREHISSSNHVAWPATKPPSTSRCWSLNSAISYVPHTVFQSQNQKSNLEIQFSHSVKAKKPAFIQSPEWQSVFPKAPIFPYHTTQPCSLTLRTQCWIILSELPSLFYQFSSLSRNQASPSPPSTPSNIDSELDILAFKAERLFHTIKAWLEGESETLCLTAYPDVISAVLDCSSSMALLALLKMIASLQRARSRFSSPESPSSTQSYQGTWEDPVLIDYWRNRAMTAFAFVQGQSIIASKVLVFGMEQLSLLAAKSEKIEMQDHDL